MDYENPLIHMNIFQNLNELVGWIEPKNLSESLISEVMFKELKKKENIKQSLTLAGLEKLYAWWRAKHAACTQKDFCMHKISCT